MLEVFASQRLCLHLAESSSHSPRRYRGTVAVLPPGRALQTC